MFCRNIPEPIQVTRTYQKECETAIRNSPKPEKVAKLINDLIVNHNLPDRHAAICIDSLSKVIGKDIFVCLVKSSRLKGEDLVTFLIRSAKFCKNDGERLYHEVKLVHKNFPNLKKVLSPIINYSLLSSEIPELIRQFSIFRNTASVPSIVSDDELYDTLAYLIKKGVPQKVSVPHSKAYSSDISTSWVDWMRKLVDSPNSSASSTTSASTPPGPESSDLNTEVSNESLLSPEERIFAFIKSKTGIQPKKGDPYSMFGLKSTDSDLKVKLAQTYKKMALSLHPDKNIEDV